MYSSGKALYSSVCEDRYGCDESGAMSFVDTTVPLDSPIQLVCAFTKVEGQAVYCRSPSSSSAYLVLLDKPLIHQSSFYLLSGRLSCSIYYLDIS